MYCNTMKTITNFDDEYRNNKTLCMAYLSHLAYHKLTEIPIFIPKTGGTFVRTFNYNGTQAFYAEFDTFRIVSFRGTELDESVDIKADFKFFKKKFNGFRAHSGFVNALHRVSAHVLDVLYDRDDDRPLYFVGHSLGGALAILLATIYTPTEIYTFAAPRVSSGHKFEKYFDGVQHNRFTNSWDLVPFMPPACFGFTHTGVSTSFTGKRFNIIESHRSEFYVKQIKKFIV